MTKVVINSGVGEFGLSQKALEMFARLEGETGTILIDQIPRIDYNLIKVVEELGDLANGENSSLKIVELPDDIAVGFEIEEDETGIETIHEIHRIWS